MAVPLVLDALFDLAGPFLFPVVLFVLGLAGYGILVALDRLEPGDCGPDPAEGPSSDDGDATPPPSDDGDGV